MGKKTEAMTMSAQRVQDKKGPLLAIAPTITIQSPQDGTTFSVAVSGVQLTVTGTVSAGDQVLAVLTDTSNGATYQPDSGTAPQPAAAGTGTTPYTFTFSGLGGLGEGAQLVLTVYIVGDDVTVSQSINLTVTLQPVITDDTIDISYPDSAGSPLAAPASKPVPTTFVAKGTAHPYTSLIGAAVLKKKVLIQYGVPVPILPTPPRSDWQQWQFLFQNLDPGQNYVLKVFLLRGGKRQLCQRVKFSTQP
jgi:hypothetical protein